MSVSERMHDAKWTMAECHLISQAAYEKHIQAEPWQIHDHMDLWRQWYYGMIPWNVVLALPGIQPISVSSR